MSKVKENTIKNKEVNNDIKKIEPKEAIDTLKVQLEEHMKQADFHKTMALKAQGALEVLTQMHPENKNES